MRKGRPERGKGRDSHRLWNLTLGDLTQVRDELRRALEILPERRGARGSVPSHTPSLLSCSDSNVFFAASLPYGSV